MRSAPVVVAGLLCGLSLSACASDSNKPSPPPKSAGAHRADAAWFDRVGSDQVRLSVIAFDNYLSAVRAGGDPTVRITDACSTMQEQRRDLHSAELPTGPDILRQWRLLLFQTDSAVSACTKKRYGAAVPFVEAAHDSVDIIRRQLV